MKNQETVGNRRFSNKESHLPFLCRLQRRPKIFRNLGIFEKTPIDNIHISSRSRITFSTHNKDTKVHIRPEIAQGNFKNLVLTMGAIEKNGQDLSYIDLSFRKFSNNVNKKLISFLGLFQFSVENT